VTTIPTTVVATPTVEEVTYPLAIYREPVRYSEHIRTQLRYAVGTTGILMLLALL